MEDLKLNVGDEVEVYNSRYTRKGIVVAILIERLYTPQYIVEHRAFGAPEPCSNTPTIYQRFQKDGSHATSSEVKIRYPRIIKIVNIYGNFGSQWSDLNRVRWLNPDESEIERKNRGECKGYLQGTLNPITNKISNIVYTTLE